MIPIRAADRHRRRLLQAGIASVAIAGAFVLPANAIEPSRTVVELFTSQGCSSCPPADAYLERLSQRPDVLALSFGVTYWDRLGWRDTFARKEFTARQVAYEQPLGEAGPFTPQMVVGGRASATGSDTVTVERLIAAQRAAVPATSLSVRRDAVLIGAGRAPAGGADIWLVQYDPNRIEIPVRRGENAGRRLSHTHVVRKLALIGEWSGAAATIAFAPADEGLRTAVIVQGRNHGPIAAAGTN